jgi:hypothetical protein
VLLITDIYGWKVDATRVWADNMAKQVGQLSTEVIGTLQAQFL